MRLFTAVLYLAVVGAVHINCGRVAKSARPALSFPYRQQAIAPRLELPRVTTCLEIRGGSLELPDKEEGNVLVQKTRNVVRSLLEILHRKSPAAASLFRSVVKGIENVTGLKLLPRKKKGKKKKKHEKTKKSKSRAEHSTTKSKDKKTKSTSDEKLIDEEKPEKTKNKTTKATQKHLDTKLTNKHANYRIQRELKEFIKSPPPNLSVKVGSNMRIWVVTMTGAKNTIYEGEVYKLRIQFPKDYPTVPPSVYFLPPAPQHEHVYTNGDICLSLLGKGWKPTMTAQSIAVSILSILSSAQTKQIPMDNARHAQNKPGQYQKDWVYHDDNC